MTLQSYILLGLSLLIGSFIANLALRTSAGESALWTRSKCRSCHGVLGVPDLVPLLSWLALRGCCRRCGAAITPFYFIVEATAVLVFFWSLWLLPAQYLWAGCLLGWVLLALGAIDVLSYRLPDYLTLPLIVLGVTVNSSLTPARSIDFVIGAMGGYILFVLVALGYRRWRGREGLGLGDAKLLSAAGAWVGWQGLPAIIFLAAALGLVAALLWRGKGASDLAGIRIPFGPFLGLALWLTWLYGPLI